MERKSHVDESMTGIPGRGGRFINVFLPHGYELKLVPMLESDERSSAKLKRSDALNPAIPKRFVDGDRIRCPLVSPTRDDALRCHTRRSTLANLRYAIALVHSL